MTTGRLYTPTKIKGLLAPIGVTATALACLAVGLPAAQAGTGSDSDGLDPVFGDWVLSGYTDPQTDLAPPADPDGQEGEDNLANVAKIGERYQQTAPGTESTELSGWVRTAPAGDGWVQLRGAAGETWVQDSAAYDETVVVVRAWTETVVDQAAHWQRYSWTGGPHESDDPPAFPSDDWQRNVAGDPHDRGVEGAYFRSNGNNGKGDWFYLQAVAPETHTIEHPAVTQVIHHLAQGHQEFSYERLVTIPGAVEYYWSIYSRTNTEGLPTEPDVPSVPTEPTVPTETPVPGVPTQPSLNGEASGQGQDEASATDDSTKPHASSPRPTQPSALPLSIDAGL